MIRAWVSVGGLVLSIMLKEQIYYYTCLHPLSLQISTVIEKHNSNRPNLSKASDH
jgi:hypothetical protein